MRADGKESLRKEFEAEAGRETVRLPQSLCARYAAESCLQFAEQKYTCLVRSLEDGRKYVIKCARQEYRKLLEEEALLLRQEKIPFLPRYVEYCEEDGWACLVREYIAGNTLWEIVEAQGAFPPSEALSVLYRIAGMLKQLHGRRPSLVHRDLKPQNIVLTAKGECYLIDMGTARRTEDGKEHDTVIMGTRSVAAPEQFGYSQSDARTDIYAFGILMNYLLTGSMCVREQGEIPDRLWKMITKCVEFDPKRRYQSAAQLEKELLEIMTGQIVQSRYHRMAERAVVAVAVLICILAVGGKAADVLNSKAALAEKEVEFSDSLLEAAVRQELGKKPEEAVYQEELADVRQLLLCGDIVFSDYASHEVYYGNCSISGEPAPGQGSVSDLTLLKDMPNLRFLVLDHQNITDISPLAELDLEKVSLCGNSIDDISPLQNSGRLTELYLENTAVSDLSVLANKERLEVLDIAFTRVNSLEPLRGLGITRLEMFEVHCDDYSALYELPLRTFLARDLPADVMQQVVQIESLEKITAYNSGVTSLKQFAGLTRLRELDVYDNSISDLEGIEDLPNLIMLCVGQNPISEMELPEGMPLKFMNVRNTNIRDFTFAAKLETLQQLDIDSEQKRCLDEQIPDPAFLVSVSDD